MASFVLRVLRFKCVVDKNYIFFLVYGAALLGNQILTFRNKVISLLSTIKMTVVAVSSLLVVQKMLRSLQMTSLLGDVM